MDACAKLRPGRSLIARLILAIGPNLGLARLEVLDDHRRSDGQCRADDEKVEEDGQDGVNHDFVHPF